MSLFVRLTDWIPAVRKYREKENRRQVLRTVDEMLERLRKRRANETQTLAEIEFRKSFLPKSKCNHLKGGTAYPWGIDIYRGASKHKDYNVGMHTFPDRSQKITCLTCHRVWVPGKRGWKQALEMVETSSNHPSTSEQIICTGENLEDSNPKNKRNLR